MGERGPIPKRSDQRIRRNKENGPITTIAAIGPISIPELGIDNPHPIIQDLYRSLAESAQSKYYESSDWQYARLTMFLANEMLTNTGGKPISAMKISAVNSMMADLLMTEADRRRVQLEVERTIAEGVVVDVASVFRQRLEAEAQQSG